jgi:hypothetical protein
MSFRKYQPLAYFLIAATTSTLIVVGLVVLAVSRLVSYLF